MPAAPLFDSCTYQCCFVTDLRILKAGINVSRHALLVQPSGGFKRTSSNELCRSISDRGVSPGDDLLAVVDTPHVHSSEDAVRNHVPGPDAGPPAAANGSVWSESRKELELAIQAEKAKDHSDWNPDLQSEEQRLRKRLAKLSLEMKVMVGDGNCQVSLAGSDSLRSSRVS